MVNGSLTGFKVYEINNDLKPILIIIQEINLVKRRITYFIHKDFNLPDSTPSRTEGLFKLHSQKLLILDTDKYL